MSIAEALWQRLFDHLVSQGHVPRSAKSATAADLAAIIDRARGDDLVSSFVERFYYPHSYGAADEAMPDHEAVALVERIVSGASESVANGRTDHGAFALDSGRTFPSLKQALAAAGPQTTIFISPGHHRASVVIDRDVRIVGRGDLTSIVLEGIDGPAVRITRGACELRHLTLAGSTPAGSEWTTPLNIEGGAPNISGCHIESRGNTAALTVSGDAAPVIDDCVLAGSGERVGMHFAYRASGQVRRCRIDGFGIAIVLVDRANPSFADCNIGPAIRNAVRASAESQGIFVRCDMKQGDETPSPDGGFALVHIEENASPRLENCSVHDGNSAAIWVDGGTCSVEGGELRAVVGGIVVTNQSRAVLRNVAIRQTVFTGVRALEDGKIELEGCTVEAAGADGLSIADRAVVSARRCLIRGSGLAGLAIWAGTAHVQDCEVRGSASAGVMFYGEATANYAIQLDRCTIADSKLTGIDVSAGGQVQLRACDILANGGHGVDVGSATFAARDSRISDNGNVGIAVSGGRIRLERVTLAQNTNGDVVLSGKAVLLARSCTLGDSGGCGLFTDDRSHAVVVDTAIGTGRDRSGIQADGSSRVALARVNIERSGHHGILVGDMARLRACRLAITGPASSGISARASARVWLNGVMIEQAGDHGIEASKGAHVACVGGLIAGCALHGVHATDQMTRVVLACTRIHSHGEASVWVGKDASIEARSCNVPPGSVVVSAAGRTSGLG